MQDASEQPRGSGPGRRARLFCVAALVACAGFAAQAGVARAQQDVTFTFDEVRFNLGDNKGIGLVDPAVPDPPALLVGDVDPATNEFTAQPDGLLFPPKLLNDVDSGNALIPLIDATIAPTAIEPITGEFNQGTGDLTIDSMNTTVSVDVVAGPGGVLPEGTALATCDSSPVPLPLETTGSIVDDDGDPPDPVTFQAAPFAPPSHEGAAVTTWDSLPVTVPTSSTGLEALVCPGVDGLVTGPGGAWFSGVATLGAPPDDDGDGVPNVQDQCPDQPGPALTDGCPDADNDGVRDSKDQCPNEAGPLSNNGCPLPASSPPGGDGEGGGAGQPAARAARLVIAATPEKRKVKAGEKAKFTAHLANGGELAAEDVEICAKGPKRKAKIKGGACRSAGELDGGASTRTKFKVKARKTAEGKKARLRFTASATGVSDATDTAKLKIK